MSTVTIRLATALVAVSVGLLAGCAADTTPGRPAPTTAPPSTYHVTAPPPDPSTADGVAVLALTQIYTWNPAVEPPGVSLLRARQWLGPKLRAVLDHPATGVEIPKPSAQWSDWAARKAIIEAFAFASGEQAPDTGSGSSGAAAPASPVEQSTPVLRRMLCKIGIEQTVVYPDGHRDRLPPTTVIATVVLTPDGWLLDDYR
jgi:hypothetical protein